MELFLWTENIVCVKNMMKSNIIIIILILLTANLSMRISSLENQVKNQRLVNIEFEKSIGLGIGLFEIQTDINNQLIEKNKGK